MPWANGGGTTWEVTRHPADPATEFIWRVSIAEIADTGPFSALPGLDRIFMLASPAPIGLRINDTEQQAGFARPIRFCGEDAVACTTAEPATALNVMTRRGSARADVEVVQAQDTRRIQATDHQVVLLVPLAGGTELHDSNGTRALRVLQATTVGDRPVTLSGSGVAAVVRLTAIQAN
jgi:uncharacterized protein